MGKGPRQDENRSGEGRTSAQGGEGADPSHQRSVDAPGRRVGDACGRSESAPVSEGRAQFPITGRSVNGPVSCLRSSSE